MFLYNFIKLYEFLFDLVGIKVYLVWNNKIDDLIDVWLDGWFDDW